MAKIQNNKNVTEEELFSHNKDYETYKQELALEEKLHDDLETQLRGQKSQLEKHEKILEQIQCESDFYQDELKMKERIMVDF